MDSYSDLETRPPSDFYELVKKIKPCPFCGKDANLSWLFNEKGYADGYYVCCVNPFCGARMIPEITGYIAIEKWNERNDVV